MRQAAATKMRELRQAGHSIERIATQLVVPQVGKGRKPKKKFKVSVAAKLQSASSKKKKSAAMTEAAEEQKEFFDA